MRQLRRRTENLDRNESVCLSLVRACDVMYEAQPRSRRYLNDMIYENGSLVEFGGPMEAKRRGGRLKWVQPRRATRNYRIVLARARTGTRTAKKTPAVSQERPRALPWLLNRLLLVGDRVQGVRCHTTASLMTWLHYCITYNITLLHPLLYFMPWKP